MIDSICDLPQDLVVGPNFLPFVLATYVIIQRSSTQLIYKIPIQQNNKQNELVHR